MSLAIVDASVLTSFYAADDHRHGKIRSRLAAGDALYAPAHIDAEVVSALRGMARKDRELETAVPAALRHLAAFPIRRVPVSRLFERIWELRGNVTAYDAAYVALAEQLGGPLITCDAKLAGAGGTHCVFDVIV
ncbi:type II toxin-antitoxin system VapC family toxin [Streptomyces albus]|uniref:type II toxin-antitoxin system VapC family toxin n=1 Tax=Streptomyces albus TaxID=1888 RepID=UPI0004C5E88A|nr:type II toxin-antitoxin system VapC family toxin [Streptomyces albus]